MFHCEILFETTIFQKVISAANNGHTEIDFPGARYIAYAYSGGTIFPIEIAFENEKCLVRKNFSNNQRIDLGSEIISINGESMKTILSKVYPLISAERDYLKQTKIEATSFPRLYWQLYGQQEVFEVELRNGSRTEKHTINAVDLVEGYETKRTEILDAQLTLKFYESAAYLNPGDLSGDEVIYQHFIDSAFTEINTVGKEHLIIDLRNNKGGDNSFGDYLVSYFADQPFKWCKNIDLKSSKFLKEHTRLYNDTTATYFQNILRRNDGETYHYEFEPYEPKTSEKRFHGQVYVLINRQSHSQSAVTAAQIQDYEFGTIVGEETGDYASLFASLFEYPLPNTGIIAKVAKGFITRVNGSKKRLGVIPDIIIPDLLRDEKDEILDGLLKRLR